MGQMYFDVWPADDYNGTALGYLSEATDKHIRSAENAIGHGQFTINRHSSQYDWCEPDNLVRVRLEAGGPFDYDDSRYIYAFIIEEGKDTLVSTDEEGGEEVTRQGRDAIAQILRRAVIYPTSSHPDNTIYWNRALKDGVVRFNAANFAEGGRSVGSVLRTFFRDAESRSPNPLEPLDDDFSYGLDSNGDSWTETDTDWEFPVGLDYLSLLERLVSAGLWFKCSPALILSAYEASQGSDLSGSISFAKGTNIISISERDIHASPAVSRVIVKGTTNTDNLKFREVIDSGVETDLGRREGYVEYEATPTNARLDLAGHKRIDTLKDQHDGPTTATVLDETGGTAFEDYFPGDTVEVDIPGVWDELAIKIKAISLDDIENGEYDPTLEFLESPWDGQDLNDLGQPEEGEDGSGNCRGCPPLEPYEPPTEEPVETPVPCDNGTLGLSGHSGVNLGPHVPPNGNAATPSPAPGLVQYFRAGIGPISTPSTTHTNSWQFPVFGAIGTLDYCGANLGNALRLVTVSSGTLTPDAYFSHSTSGSWKLVHMSGASEVIEDSGSIGLDGTVPPITIPDDGHCYHVYIIHAFTSAGPGRFNYAGYTWEPDTTITNPPYTPPVPGQEGREQIPGTTGSTTYTTNFPYVPGSLRVTVNGVSVVPDETDPAAGEFELLGDYTGQDVVVRYTIASATGTGATNPPPDPDEPTAGVTDHGDLTGLSDDDHTQYVLTNEGGRELAVPHGNLGSTEDIDPTDGNVHTGTLDANSAITLLPPDTSRAGAVSTVELYLTENGTGGFTPSFLASGGSIVWPGGVAPTHDTTADSVSRYIFETVDDGVTWYGNIVGSGSTSSTLAVKDEGVVLPTDATTLDFVGPGVTATGSGATKTITIPGGTTADDPYLWRPLMDGTGAVVVDGTGQAVMAYGPA